MRLAYADPPYPGLAGYYPERCEVDHAALVSRLERFDGWALSTSRSAVRDVLALCPASVKVCAWFKRPRSGAAWEPVIVKAARNVSPLQVPDALIYQGRYNAFPGAMVGMKPPQFSEWVFRLIGACRGDTFEDLFPGSGAVSEAWRRFVRSDPSRVDVAPDVGDASRWSTATRRSELEATFRAAPA